MLSLLALALFSHFAYGASLGKSTVGIATTVTVLGGVILVARWSSR